MTDAFTLEPGRRAPSSRNELRRRMLALVLALVLVWYTFVVPAGAVASARPVSDDDGEVRDFNSTDAKSGPQTFGDAQAFEELEWPEYIYVD